MGLDIIGAGFGRTGTLSLKVALEQLGFERCYHMVEVIANEGHADFWLDAIEGRPVDWNAIFAGFRATVDWPACHYWRELAAHYPEAKVLLSVRPADGWYESVHETIYRAMTETPMDEVPPSVRNQLTMARKLVLEGDFGGRFEDRAHAIGVYEAHNQAVEDAFEPDRLLVYEVGSGWAPICAFLDVPVPEDDFPRVNDRESFRARLEQMP